jgi:hypothetical protein
MKTTKNDNRMGWIRNAKILKKNDSDSYFIEYEIASECDIPGIFVYQNGIILCGLLSSEKDQKGLRHYTLKIGYPRDTNLNYESASKRGYYFKDGVLGEILALFSLYFQCRFYLLATFFGELAHYGLKVKNENKFLYQSCNYQIHPQIFSNKNKNFSVGLCNFFDSVKSLKAEYHQHFILACSHYARALKEVGVDSEMVFIRLVSAIEIVSSKFFKLNKKDDPFSGKNFDEVIRINILSKEEKDDLKKIFENRKSKKKFIRFIEKYSKGFFKGGNYRAKHLKIKRKDLPKVLSAIYDARSSYLHTGEPMYLSLPLRDQTKWDIDPSLGMIIDRRKISKNKKLPYTYFFEGLVRRCLLNFLRENQTI